ncbi:MAG: fatty-acid oxidation protein subunit alpha [Alphaproteobacteria bacterium]|nr:fatty-acid oxidation protein subunit alpha [Alphaproteobacteria bacterium]
MRPLSDHVAAALEPRQIELGLPPGAGQELRHWRYGRDDRGVVWLLFDKEGAAVNTIDEAVLRELDDILRRVASERPAGLVLRSAKRSGFCAGADVAQFAGAQDPDAVEQRLRQGHVVVDRLAEMEVPTVAVVHGHCLGGGLELALACRYRIAVDGASFGFPEILLGLHPGLGGTARSVQLIEPVEAMTMMLTGRTVHTAKAKALGLVDAVTEERHVAAAVRTAVTEGLGDRRDGLKAKAERLPALREVIARRMRREAARRAPPEFYPAPAALIDLWVEHAERPAAMRREEVASFARLLATPTAQNLIRVFFLREKMKALGKAGGRPVRHVHVIGAGAMGGDIAGWCALKGLRVTLSDMKTEAIGGAVRRTAELCRQRHLSRADTRDVMDRLAADPHNRAVGQADLVIEAVPEKLDIKRSLYESIEPKLKPQALLATNTSSIGLDDLAAGLRNPGRLVGLHFFNPVSRMDLVEVVRHREIFEATFTRARTFVGQIDKLAAPVASAPGFLVNRALMPYLAEAMAMLDEGVGPATVDAAAETFGMPMGPVEVADRVGLDICLDVAEMLSAKLGLRDMPGLDRLRRKVEAKELGMKTGKGFYPWSGGKPKKGAAGTPPEAAADRLILPLLNACVACLREGVVADEDIVDGAMIFGTGFAPFTGGPLYYARKRGIEEIVRMLTGFEQQWGPRFAPDEGWVALAE